MSVEGFFARPGWGVLSIEGDDTWSFLQNLVSQDLDPLGDGDCAYSLLLTPQGRIVSEFRVCRVDARNALLDTANGTNLADALGAYLIRTKAQIVDLTAEWSTMSVRGSQTVDVALSLIGGALPDAGRSGDAALLDQCRVVRVDWATGPGFDLIGPSDAIERAAESFTARGVAPLGHESFERLRIESGVPRFALDFDESTLPHEVLLDRDAVSFTKGCFLGQEVVGRIDARGRAPKLLRRLEIPVSGASIPGVGSDVRDASDRVVGTLTSVAGVPSGGAVGLAILPVAIEPPAEVTIDGTPAQVFAIA